MDEKLKELQMVEYDMLKDVVDFCDKNGIKYFIIAGTLLGAVRHGGFIPWDDDIDIGMDYHNYKLFLKKAQKGLDKKFFIQNFYSERKVSNPWTKIRINGTTSIDPRFLNYDIHSGICMDIFLFNGISDNRVKRKIQEVLSRYQRQMLKKYYYLEGDIPNKNKRINQIVPEILRPFLIKVFDKLINIDLSKTKYCYNTFYDDVGKKFCYESKWFTELKKITFEDGQFYAPISPEDYLVARYGDWKTPPPKNERTAHGDIIIDTNKDYTFYKEKREPVNN